MKLHFMPVRNPAPPRPRRSDSFTSAVTAAGSMLQGLAQGLVAFPLVLVGLQGPVVQVARRPGA